MPATDTLTQRLGAELAPDFRLLRLLGDGAVARVYLASETALERLVAVKVLRPEFSEDEVVRRRFAREARAAARIVHPNVVDVHRVGALADGLPYLITEYIEGRTLADLLAAEGTLETEHARSVLEQIAAALAAAHQKGIIHRDVRPANILVENDTQRVVLTDFGIAGIKETGSEIVTRLTQAGEGLGDPRYASPEQLLGEPVTEETDVYSFGVVGYEILTGSGPFAATSARELVAAHLQHSPRNLREVRADAEPELARLLERCLAKKPEHRPRAAEVRATLGAVSPEVRSAHPSHPHAAAEAVAEHEPPFFPALANFLAELRRRRVYRTAATYLAVAFVALQGADLVFPALAVAPWVYPVLVVIALAGFPVVVVLTWIFDINRSGIERTPDPPSTTLLAGDRLVRRLFQVVGLLLSVLAAALLGWWILG